MVEEIGQRVFNKAVRLLEQRLKIKIKTAVLSIDTDFGVFQYTLTDDLVANLFLMEKLFHQELIQLATKGQVSGGTVVCPECLGAGEIITNKGFGYDDILVTCPRCNGGGEMVAMLDKTGDKK